MKHFLITIAAIFALCCQLIAEEKTNSALQNNHQYKGAFDTFYNYIRILNKNELTEENIRKLFNKNFCFHGNPNLILSTYEENNNWLLNSIEEVRVKNYPVWNQVNIRNEFKYSLKVPINKLKPLLASELK